MQPAHELELAIAADNRKAVASLLAGPGAADLANRPDEWGWTPLLSATCRGFVAVALLLLDAGASIDVRTPGSASVLHLLCGLRSDQCAVDSLAALFERLVPKLDVNSLDSDGQSALFSAVKGRNEAAAALLLTHGVDVKIKNRAGETALLRAVHAEDVGIVKLLLKAGARDDNAYRKALESPRDAIKDLAPLMAPPSRTSLPPSVVPLRANDEAVDAPADVTPNAAMPDALLLLPSPPDSATTVVWGQLNPSKPEIVPRPEWYRDRFLERAHDVYFGEVMVEGALMPHYCVCCVSRWADAGWHDAVTIDSRGFVPERFSTDDVKHGMLNVLGARDASVQWVCLSDTSLQPQLRAHLLAMECKMARKRLTVGVVFGQNNQWKEADMFETARLESYQLEFMQALGHSVTITPAWPHFQGQLVAGAKAYYTVLDGGWEIVFHVAPLLSADERRQYVGNDKVVIYVCEEGVKPFVPRFRGEVNSVGLVCQRRQNGWKMAAFFKERVSSQLFKPVFPGSAMTLAELREYVLVAAINGHAATLASPPYSTIVAKAYQEQLSQVAAMQRRSSGISTPDTKSRSRSSIGFLKKNNSKE